jgi:hypothetical protein
MTMQYCYGVVDLALILQKASQPASGGPIAGVSGVPVEKLGMLVFVTAFCATGDDDRVVGVVMVGQSLPHLVGQRDGAPQTPGVLVEVVGDGVAADAAHSRRDRDQR